MSTVDLKPHTTRLGGKDYVMVSGRVLLAHEDNPELLTIETQLLKDDDDSCIFQATVTTRKGVFTGTAASYKKTGTPQEKKTPLECSETSAVGRALAFAGYAIANGIASADEVARSEDSVPQEAPQARPKATMTAHPQAPVLANKGQLDEIVSLANETGSSLPDLYAHYHIAHLSELTEARAAEAIKILQRKPKVAVK